MAGAPPSADAVELPHAAWWMLVIGGLTVLALQSFSSPFYAWWVLHVNPLPGQIVMRWILVACLPIHLNVDEKRPGDTIPSGPPAVIVAGRAQLAVSLALAKVAKEHTALEGAILELEGVATACARALDATATTTEVGR